MLLTGLGDVNTRTDTTVAPAPTPPAQDRHTRAPPENGTPLDILIVDDDPDIRLVTKINLGAAGHDVREAADAPAAGALLRERPADVLICDVKMPGTTGPELIDELDTIGLLPPHVLLVSAMAAQQFAEVDAPTGTRAVRKPVGPRHIAELEERCA